MTINAGVDMNVPCHAIIKRVHTPYATTCIDVWIFYFILDQSVFQVAWDEYYLEMMIELFILLLLFYTSLHLPSIVHYYIIKIIVIKVTRDKGFIQENH